MLINCRTRAMQKLVKHITTKEQRRLVVSALSPIAVNLTKNQYGCHVIQDCVQSFPSEDNRVSSDQCYTNRKPILKNPYSTGDVHE